MRSTQTISSKKQLQWKQAFTKYYIVSRLLFITIIIYLFRNDQQSSGFYITNRKSGRHWAYCWWRCCTESTKRTLESQSTEYIIITIQRWPGWTSNLTRGKVKCSSPLNGNGSERALCLLELWHFVIVITKCHNSQKHSQSSLTMVMGKNSLFIQGAMTMFSIIISFCGINYYLGLSLLVIINYYYYLYF